MQNGALQTGPDILKCCLPCKLQDAQGFIGSGHLSRSVNRCLNCIDGHRHTSMAGKVTSNAGDLVWSISGGERSKQQGLS